MIARYPLAFVAGYYFAVPFVETYHNLKTIKKMAFRPKPTAVESDSPAPRSAWDATLHKSSNKRDVRISPALSKKYP